MKMRLTEGGSSYLSEEEEEEEGEKGQVSQAKEGSRALGGGRALDRSYRSDRSDRSDRRSWTVVQQVRLASLLLATRLVTWCLWWPHSLQVHQAKVFSTGGPPDREMQ